MTWRIKTRMKLWELLLKLENSWRNKKNASLWLAENIHLARTLKTHYLQSAKMKQALLLFNKLIAKWRRLLNECPLDCRTWKWRLLETCFRVCSPRLNFDICAVSTWLTEGIAANSWMREGLVRGLLWENKLKMTAVKRAQRPSFVSTSGFSRPFAVHERERREKFLKTKPNLDKWHTWEKRLARNWENERPNFYTLWSGEEREKLKTVKLILSGTSFSR